MPGPGPTALVRARSLGAELPEQEHTPGQGQAPVPELELMLECGSKQALLLVPFELELRAH